MLGYGPSSYAIGLYLIFLNSESSDLCFGKALLVVCPKALPVRWLPPTNKAVKSKNFLSDPFFLYGVFYCKGLVKFLTVHWTDLLWVLGRGSLRHSRVHWSVLLFWIGSVRNPHPTVGWTAALAYRSPTVTRDTRVSFRLLLSSTHAWTGRYQKSTQTAFSSFYAVYAPFILVLAGT